MLTLLQNPYVIEINEPVGIAHDPQIVVMPWPDHVDQPIVSLLDEHTGTQYPMQGSLVDPTVGFLRIAIEPYQRLKLMPTDVMATAESGAVSAVTYGDLVALSNNRLCLEARYGGGDAFQPSTCESGPIVRWRHSSGPWRGATYFDTRAAVIRWSGKLIENGPLRLVYQYEAEMAGGGDYRMTVTIDDGQPTADIREVFDGQAGDQLVWTFAGDDLPSAALLLNTDAGYTRRELTYHFDQRIARLAAWTQYQQLIDLSDGFALEFGDATDVVGWVTLAGGEWRGANLNHIELWQRRVSDIEGWTRRRVPSDAKADGQSAPYGIPGRGSSQTLPQVTLEGWIGVGERRWGLVIALRDELLPALDPCVALSQLGHFDDVPKRDTYRLTQGLLRRFHARAMFPLQDQLALSFDPELGRPGEPPSSIPFELLAHHLPSEEALTDSLESTRNYLEARVYGFWEGSGAAYTNCVAGRRIAPEMLRYDWLVRSGKIGEDDRRRIGTMLLFLAHLFESDNYYPGWTTMEPLGSTDTTEPSLTGMANQNFYTDVINVFAMAAEVFQANPSVPHWRAKFALVWQRQLEYHMYPQSGVWEESHTYYQHVLLTILPTMLRRRDNGTADDFANPLLQRLVAGALKQLSPPDNAFGGKRHLVAFGDHDVNVDGTRDVYRAFADGFAIHAPNLAGNLAWAYREMHGTLPISVAPLPISWENEHVEGLGYFFRGVDPNGTQSLMALRCGSAWGHHHADDGSIQFFAHGRSLVVDAAFGNVQADAARKFQAVGHSRWSLRDHQPTNHLFRFNRGWISESKKGGPLPYAVAYSPLTMAGVSPNHYYPLARPVVHYRVVVAIDATTFLVLDTADSTEPQVVRFQLAGQSVSPTGNGFVADFDGDSTRLHIVPLIVGDSLGISRTDAPANGTPYVTTEVAYTPNRDQVTLFLVFAADPQSQASQIDTSDPGALTVTVHGRTLDLTLNAVYGARPSVAESAGTQIWLDGGAIAKGIDRGSWLFGLTKR